MRRVIRSRTTKSANETRRFAACLARRLRAGDVVLLHGDLGAGKTTFVQGLAAGLGVRTPVTSPTFTLIHEYAAGGVDLFHFDPYRLAGTGDIADLGFEDYLARGGIIVVEWGERLGEFTPPERLDVHIEVGEAETRSITLTPVGAR